MMGMIPGRTILRDRRREKHTRVMPQFHRCHTRRDGLFYKSREVEYNRLCSMPSTESLIATTSAVSQVLALNRGALNVPGLDVHRAR